MGLLKPDEWENKIKLMAETITQDWSVFSERWKLQQKAYEYLRSKQYTDEEQAYYAGQRRPTNVFNVTFDKINHICGDQLLSDQAQRVLAKRGTMEVAATWEKVNDHWHDKNDYRSQVGRTALAGWLGCGALYPRWSNEQEIDGSLVYENEDEFGIMWDPRARKKFCDDARYMARFRWMTPRQIQEEPQWKGRREELQKLLDLTPESELLHDGSEWKLKNFANPIFTDKHRGQYLVVEWHEIRIEEMEVLFNPQIPEEMTPFEIQDPKRRDLYLRANPQYRVIEKRWKCKYITSFIPGLNFFLNEKRADTQDGTYDILIYHPYPYGRFVVEHYGILPILIGPQNLINDLENRFLDAVNRTVNGGIEIIKDAYDNPEAVDQAGHAGTTYEKKAKFAPYNTLRRLEPPSFTGINFETLIKDAIFFTDLLTITENQAGRKESSNEPASLFAQRVVQAQIRFAIPQYELYSLKKRLGNKNIRITQANLTTPKLLYIVDKKVGQSEPLYLNTPMGDTILNDIRTGEYEVSVDDFTKSPLAVMLRQQDIGRVTEMLIKVFGPNAAEVIDWDGFFDKMNIGDMKEQVDLIHQFMQKSMAAQSEGTALARTSAILDTVKKNVDLQDAEEPAPPEAGAKKTSRQPARS